MNEENVRVAPPELHQAVDDALGLQAISIRLPKDLIERYKALAQERGIGYQPLMREVLIAGVGGLDDNTFPHQSPLPSLKDEKHD